MKYFFNDNNENNKKNYVNWYWSYAPDVMRVGSVASEKDLIMYNSSLITEEGLEHG